MQRGLLGLHIFHLILALPLFDFIIHCQAWPIRNYDFVVKEASYTRLCKKHEILTVNGQYPGPTLHVHKGDTIIVNVYNHGKHNITIHWHGVNQPRNPWSDGPEYITQCPIQPGNVFRQKVIFSTEEGTLWWHAHSAWERATVHGPVVIFPKHGTSYPFPKPYKEVPIILGEWWNRNISQVLKEAIVTGRNPRLSDAFTINGQPGHLYPCSKRDTYKLNVEHGKTYLLRIINAALMDILFLAVANHNLTAVAADAAYTKPLTKEYMVIAPGQTLDCLLHANQNSGQYYMAARAYSTGVGVDFDETMTTAVLQYNQRDHSTPPLPILPSYTDITAAFNVLGEFKSLADENHPVFVPSNPATRMLFTLSINLSPCPKDRVCQGPNGTKLAASLNNLSFVNPCIDVLQAYHKRVKGVFEGDFPSFPLEKYNYTEDYKPLSLEATRKATSVKFLEYNSDVELVFQGTSIVAAIDHPMHLHGYSFYVVGFGFGNFDKNKDPFTYNLVDPPLHNTVVVPKDGWVALRFKADNPGVWFMHCHLERHQLWGMNMALIVKNGRHRKAKMLPPPPDMPLC